MNALRAEPWEVGAEVALGAHLIGLLVNALVVTFHLAAGKPFDETEARTRAANFAERLGLPLRLESAAQDDGTNHLTHCQVADQGDSCVQTAIDRRDGGELARRVRPMVAEQQVDRVGCRFGA